MAAKPVTRNVRKRTRPKRTTRPRKRNQRKQAPKAPTVNETPLPGAPLERRQLSPEARDRYHRAGATALRAGGYGAAAIAAGVGGKLLLDATGDVVQDFKGPAPERIVQEVPGGTIVLGDNGVPMFIPDPSQYGGEGQPSDPGIVPVGEEESDTREVIDHIIDALTSPTLLVIAALAVLAYVLLRKRGK